MVNAEEYEEGKSLYAARDAVLYYGVVKMISRTSQFGKLVTLNQIGTEEEVHESVGIPFKLDELFLDECEACEEVVRQCDEVLEKLESKKTEVIKELREGKKRQKRLGKKLLESRKEIVEIRKKLKKELPGLETLKDV